MKLLDGQDCRGEVRITFINYLVELDLEVHTCLLLHVNDEVYAAHNDEGEEYTEDYIEVELEDTRAFLREKKGFRVLHS
jgi:hypothetical protein